VLLIIALLTFMLMPLFIIASVGQGYCPAWAFLTLALAQIATVLGWADWFPWAVPGIPANVNGASLVPIEAHSYVVVLLVFAIGVVATVRWWQSADQAR
jgi:hypothetical protein